MSHNQISSYCIVPSLLLSRQDDALNLDQIKLRVYLVGHVGT